MSKPMTNSFDGFESRLEQIDLKRAKMAQGYKASVDQDGLIVFRPMRRQRGIPLKAIVLLVVGFFVFKGMVLAQTGETMYQERIVALQSGTVLEQAGAFAMQIDPITLGIAHQLGTLIK